MDKILGLFMNDIGSIRTGESHSGVDRKCGGNGLWQSKNEID